MNKNHPSTAVAILAALPRITKTGISSLLGAALSLLTIFATIQNVSAQNQRILFDAPVTTRTKGVTTTTQHIFSMDETGANVTQLTSSTARDTSPKWSPDRQRIAFMRWLDSGIYICVMDAIGEANGGRTLLVAGPAKSTGLDWCPDNSTILFTGYPTAMDSGIWAVTVPSTGEVGTPVLLRPGVCHWPACSPDGTRIAFAEDTDGTGPGSVVVVKIREMATGAEITCGLVPSAQPSWSPDGSGLAFAAGVTVTTTARNGKQTTNHYQEIFAANADLTGITQLTNLKSVSAVPTWNPAGTELAFASQVNGTYSVYKMPLATGIVNLLRADANSPDWKP